MSNFRFPITFVLSSVCAAFLLVTLSSCGNAPSPSVPGSSPPSSSAADTRTHGGSTVAAAGSTAQGGEVSGGADSFAVTSAYFRSSEADRRIHLCYEISAQFGVPASEVESQLRWAFAQWDGYIEAKDLHYAIWTGSPGIVGKLGEVRQGCTGSEDLRVYFGVDAAEVAHFRPRFINPYAFSAISETSADRRWHKGLLWFAGPGGVDAEQGIPTWNLSSTGTLQPSIAYGALKYAVLHEVGHIFGNGHVDSTIMTSRIGQWLENWTNPREANFMYARAHELQIDQNAELVHNLNLAHRWELAPRFGEFTLPNGQNSGPDPDALRNAFRQIFGSAPVGVLTAVANRVANPHARPHERPDQAATGTGVITIEFTDQLSVHTARIITTAKVAQKDDSTPLFNGQHGNHFRSFGASFVGRLEAGTSPSIPVLVNYNMGNLFRVIDLGASGGMHHPLLESTNDWN